MELAETIATIKRGIFHIVWFHEKGYQLTRIGSGSGFVTAGYLITNFHVAHVPAGCRIWIRREGDEDFNVQGTLLSSADFRATLVAASDEKNYDYSIHDIQQIKDLKDVPNLSIRSPHSLRIGDAIAFAGYPFEHTNLTCHSGIVSSFYRSGPVNVIQLDASVNASNSGGPLFDPATGEIVGIVTRKATGLTQAFEHLRAVIRENISILSRPTGIRATVAGIDPVQATLASNQQMLHILGEIERQSNVGIGYAFSIEHLASENVIYQALNPESP